MKKNFFCMVLALCILFSLIPSEVISIKAEETVTRAEWISELVNTFSMTVEDDSNMPDNYFTDISADASYYRDILLAVEFGVIDVEAGESFRPNDYATREFAAQTLNHCLNFQLEDKNYTYSEYESVASPDDIQIAINRGWFELSGNDFLPECEITTDEMAIMIADAETIIEAEAIDENYDSTYEFDKSVIVVPETAAVTIDSDNTVTIENDDTVINEGDVFVVDKNGYPVALKAITVESSDGVTVITSTKDGTENAVITADSEGMIDVALDDFKFNELTTYSVIDTSNPNAQSEELSFEIQSIDYDEATKTLVASQKITIGSSAAGSVSVKLSNIKLGYKEKKSQGVYEAVLTADTNVTTAVSFDFADYVGIPSNIRLGYVNIGGIGSVSLDIELSMNGGISMSWDGQLKAGFNYSNENFRLIKDYTKKGFTFTAEAQVKVGLYLSASIDLVLIKGSVFASVGARMNYTANDYDSGTPRTCVTIKGYLYAYVGADVKIVGKSVFSEKRDIYTEKNSPVRVVYHYEDGVLVESCTRGQNISYTTSVSSNYFNPSPSYGQGSYGGTSDPVVIWEYSVNDQSNATITKYRGTASAVAIPSKIDGYNVVKIEKRAFSGNTAIRAVTIPDSVEEIGDSAFEDCINLTNVQLSHNLEILKSSAFSGCNSLQEIEIPKSLTETSITADGGPFNNSGLKTATFEVGTTKVVKGLFDAANKLESVELTDTITKLEDYAFRNCTSLKEVTIPNSVLEIGGYTFSNCTSLDNIIIPNSVVKIGNYAFNSCTSFKEMIVPNSVEEIGDSAFKNCINLANAQLSQNLKTLKSSAFSGCDSLQEIEIPKSLTETSITANGGPFNNSGLKTATFEIGTTKVVKGLFDAANKLESVELTDTITKLEDYAFRNCTSLKELTIPNSVAEIGGYTFSNCTSLDNTIIPNSVVKIGNYAFNSCTSLKEMIIPNSVEEIGDSAFKNCINLANVQLSQNLKTLKSSAFSGCDSLQEIEIPKSLTETSITADGGPFNNSGLKTATFEVGTTKVVNGLFDAANKLESVELTDTITKLEDYAFRNCTSLKEIMMQDSVLEIGNYTFSNCTSLNNIIIPNSVAYIGSYAFNNCTSLNEIIIPNSVTDISKYTFYKCSSLQKASLSNKTETIGESAFAECVKLSDINMPNTIKRIYSNAFYNCDALLTINADISGTIDSRAFYDCDALTTLIIGDGVTSIGSEICYHCDSLSDLKLGKNITAIPSSSFRMCQNLKEVTLPRYCSTVSENAFAENTALTSVYVPPYVSSIADNVFSYPARMTIYGKSGTYAEEYANSKSIAFNAVTQPITSLEYEQSSIKISKSGTVTPNMIIQPSFDTDTIIFLSSNTNVATVSETGAITGVNYGTATISALTGSGILKTIDVTVVKPATAISIDKTSLEMNEGKVAALIAAISPSDSNDSIEWSSNNESVAVVDSNGNVSGISPGIATITAKAVFGNKTASCIVNVIPSGIEIVAVTGITLDKSEYELPVGDKYTLNATVAPDNATNKLVQWTSSDTRVATVENGVVTANATGTTTITAKTMSGDFEATCVVTVVPKVDITNFSVTQMGEYGLINISAVNIPSEAQIYIVAYDDDRCMSTLQQVELNNGSAQTIVNIKNVKKIKAFIWNMDMKPICKFKEYDL